MLSGPRIGANTTCFDQPTLNAFMALGLPVWHEVRTTLQRLLSASEGALRDNVALRQRVLVPAAEVNMHLPAAIGDYTDFYASREHATNIGVMFRGPQNALQPNWLHLPVGYHGRASSIVVSGTNVRRPWGQVLPPVEPGAVAAPPAPVFQPSAALDYELEMGCFIGPGNEMGAPIPAERAADHIFGYVLVNDWSARDVQKWEYVPLGPFNGKNFATSISPWVVTPAALEPFACPAPEQHGPAPLPYLRLPSGNSNYDVHLEVAIQGGSSSGSGVDSSNGSGSGSATAGVAGPTAVTRSNMKTMYWTLPQMIAHHTAGGCNLRTGDLLATGTLSREGPQGAGCLQEATWNGTCPMQLSDGSQRTFLQDGDTVILTGYCQGEGYRVGFGECRGTLLPALPPW